MNKQQLETYILEAIHSGYLTNNAISTYVEEILNISRFKSDNFKLFIDKVLSKFIGVRNCFVLIDDSLININYQYYPTLDNLWSFKDDEYREVKQGLEKLNEEIREDLTNNLVKSCINCKLNRQKVINLYPCSDKNLGPVIRTIDYTLNCLKFLYQKEYQTDYFVINLLESYVNQSLDSFLNSKDLSQLNKDNPLTNPQFKKTFCNI